MGDEPEPPSLSSAEEAVLFAALRAGDSAAAGRIFAAHLRLVDRIANDYERQRWAGLDPDALIAAGQAGLLQAIGRFDVRKGFRFSTYATHWIRQAIGRALDAWRDGPRLADFVRDSLRLVDRVRDRLREELGQEPTEAQLAKVLGVSPKRLRTLLQHEN